MERLGLWGDGTAFKSFDSFLASITKRGLGKWHSFQPREQEEKKDKEGEREEGISPSLLTPLLAVFSAHISLHRPHNLNSWNRSLHFSIGRNDVSQGH